MKELEVKKLCNTAKLPTRAYKTDCGLDLYCSIDCPVVVPSGQGYVFPTGIAANFPNGYVGMLTDRSSMAKKGFKVAGGIIDPGFTGELKVVLRNISDKTLTVEVGDRIGQLLIIPISTPEVVEVEELRESERSTSGFGSSGA